MPSEAGVSQPDMLTLLAADVRDQQDLRIAWKQVFLDDMDLELAKSVAEFNMPLV